MFTMFSGEFGILLLQLFLFLLLHLLRTSTTTACEFGRVERRDQLLAWGLGGTSYSFTRQVPILRKYHLLTGSFLAFHIFWSCLFVKLDDGVDEEDFLKRNLRIF